MKTKIKILHIAYCNSAKQVWISTVLVHVISSIAYPVTNQIAMLSSSFAELGPAQPQLVFLHFSTKNSTFYLFSAFPLKSKVVYRRYISKSIDYLPHQPHIKEADEEGSLLPLKYTSYKFQVFFLSHLVEKSLKIQDLWDKLALLTDGALYRAIPHREPNFNSYRVIKSF